MKNTEEQVLAVYQEENPSIHGIEYAAAFHRMAAKRTKLFHDALKFPPKMFEGERLIDVGAGTGENTVFYARWGARCTLVDVNAVALARAKLIFRQYSPLPARYVRASLFGLPRLGDFDLVACQGVIHHTADKWRALDVLASLLKPDGYLLLAVGNAAGAWQRMLQRLLVYRFGTSTDLIGRTAAYLFPEHLERASRLGQRSRRAIIFDTYVNPKIDCLTMPELLRWCRRRAMSVYSAAPNFIPPFQGDAPTEEFDITAQPASGMMAELVWMLHHETDERGVPDLLRSSQKLARSLEHFVSFIHDVSPTREYRLSKLLDRADALTATAKASDPWAGLRGKLLLFMRDVRAVVTVAARNDLPALRRAILKTRILFKGTSGLGMNYYVLHKPD